MFVTGFVLLSVMPAATSSGATNTEPFSRSTAALKWRSVYLSGAPSGGSASVSSGRLKLSLKSLQGLFALFSPQKLSGNFYTEVEIDRDDASGLVLIKSKNGAPDPDNFTSIRIETGRDGKVRAVVQDRENGRDNVLDHTGNFLKDSWWGKQYSMVLDGQYALPGNSRRKLRIFRDSAAGVFHFFFQVRPIIHGKQAIGWIEMAPSPDWNGKGNSAGYFAGVCVQANGSKTASAGFDNFQTTQVPVADRDDRSTGFKITKRDYNWSGWFGHALVVTFGKETPYSASDCKLAFWSKANYVPFFQINNQLGQSYEFIETWGAKKPGCYEPMSDRLLRYSKVNIVEDNAVRKVIHWSYTLMDPDYVYWGELTNGKLLPVVDEYWTVYPDGQAVRQQIYKPCTDSTEAVNWNQVVEMDALIGSAGKASDHLDPQTVTVLNQAGAEQNYTWPGKSGDFNKEPNKWTDVICAVHYLGKNTPDTYAAFERKPQNFGQTDWWIDSSWHRTGWYSFVHWPCDTQPYAQPNGTQWYHGGLPSHTSLINIGAPGNWNTNYQVDANGRHFRQWTSLVGLNGKRDYTTLRQRTATWMYGGKVSETGPGFQFVAYRPVNRELVIKRTGAKVPCKFTLSPSLQAPVLIHPIFRVENWTGAFVKINLNGKLLTSGKDYRAAIVHGALLVYLNRVIDKPVKIGMSSR